MKFDVSMTYKYDDKELNPAQRAVISESQKTALTLYTFAMEDNENDLKDYLSDNLDITFMIGKDKELEGIRVWLELGGPGLYVDTYSQEVVCAWSTEEAACFLPPDVCDYIEDAFGIGEYNKIK